MLYIYIYIYIFLSLFAGAESDFADKSPVIRRTTQTKDYTDLVKEPFKMFKMYNKNSYPNFFNKYSNRSKQKNTIR